MSRAWKTGFLKTGSRQGAYVRLKGREWAEPSPLNRLRFGDRLYLRPDSLQTKSAPGGVVNVICFGKEGSGSVGATSGMRNRIELLHRQRAKAWCFWLRPLRVPHSPLRPLCRSKSECLRLRQEEWVRFQSGIGAKCGSSSVSAARRGHRPRTQEMRFLDCRLPLPSLTGFPRRDRGRIVALAAATERTALRASDRASVARGGKAVRSRDGHGTEKRLLLVSVSSSVTKSASARGTEGVKSNGAN